MKRTIFLYSGEGTHSNDSRFRLLQQSPLWQEIDTFVQSRLDTNLESLWMDNIGTHRCPASPLLTVATQICLADLWQRWGYRPDVVVGHSTGELAAAYEAGLYSLEEILQLAHGIGEAASQLDGAMLHGYLPEGEQLPVNISSFNFDDQIGRHVTVSGFVEEMASFSRQHPDFTPMQLPHPWHHPDYDRFADRLPDLTSSGIEDGRFVSGVTTRFESRLADDHWHRWLVNPVDFIKTLQTVAERCVDDHVEIIEIGFHPVLEKCLHVFPDRTHAASMFRGEDDIQYILHQRRKLDQTPFLAELKRAIDAFEPGLDYGLALAYQGFNSLKFTEFSLALQPCFPTLAPQDFYRYKTVNQLIDRFGVASTARPPAAQSARQHDVVIAGMSCRFPAGVETLTQFWDTLASGSDQVRLETGRGAAEAGFLSLPTSRFDHRFFNISQVEARTMDPQQILALELTEMLWRDAGIDPKTLDRRRVGVYMGVWSQEYRGDPTSVYYPSGTNPSIVAARISYHYDLRGPSWVSNTACSSSLVAVHYAAKDIEAGRVDFAIAGGVNMILDEAFTNAMGNSGFLSSDHRCKAFDDAANGYVRAEGGGLVLLVNKSLVDRYYAELTGSAINQNGGRSQVITAPHPEAQEELIEDACQDAGIAPQEIAYVECHGTGTKIGDPIEMSAILNTVAKDRPDTCYVGSVKSNIGHLESAAGIAGLIKAVTTLNHGVIPPNLHFRQPNQHIDFAANPVKVVVEPTPIDQQANVGVSSFGFGGSNAHLLLRGAETAMRKKIEPLEVPFDRDRAVALDAYVSLVETPSGSPAEIAPTVDAGPDVRQTIRTLLFGVTGVESIEPDIELLDQGLDSMSATEMIRHLEETFEVEIEPDVLFEFPLFDQFAEEIERRIRQQPADGIPVPVTRGSVEQLVNDLFFQLTHIEAIDPDIELTDQGLDSMSGTELVSQLENALGIEIGPEILFEYPLKDQFVDEVFALAGRLN